MWLYLRELTQVVESTIKTSGYGSKSYASKPDIFEKGMTRTFCAKVQALTRMSPYVFESPRVSRKLNTLRGLSLEEDKQVLA